MAQNITELMKQAEVYREKGDLNSEVQVLNKLAFKQWEKGNYFSSAESFNRIIEINKLLNNKNGILITYYNLGAVYSDTEDYQMALQFFMKGYDLSKSLGKKKDVVSCLTNAASVLREMKEYEKSNAKAKEALVMAKEINDLKMLRTCYRILAENYENLGITDKTIEYYDLFNTFDKKIKNMQMEQVKEESAGEVNKAQAEKRAKEIELKQTVDTLQEVKEISATQKMEIKLLNQQKEIDRLEQEQLEKTWKITLTGLLIALMFLAIIFYQFNQKRKANNLLAERNHKINHQNKQITDSIKYAKTIQKAILPIHEAINQSFESFIIFRPKDIVSGDFYWYSTLEPGKKWIIAVVDCTGHGVPGAFMSMIGNTLLNSVVNERKIHRPSKILEILNDETVEALKQEKTENKDGMDVCLCYLEKMTDTETKLIFSGAKRPLLYYNHTKGTVEEIKPGRFSIGGMKLYVDNIDFSDVEMTLNKGDILYLSSDGYIDQNASDRKRFGSKRLISVLNTIAKEPMKKQGELMEQKLEDYMQGEEQRDDIAFVGIKI